MGQCIYCGNPAGFLKKTHKECKQQHEQGKSEVISLVGKIGAEGGDLHRLESSIESVASTSFIDKNTLNSLVASGWERAVNIAFDDGLLSEEEESALSELKEHFSLPQQILDRNGVYSKLVKGAVLRDIMNGN
jgi:hypothetical protein